MALLYGATTVEEYCDLVHQKMKDEGAAVVFGDEADFIVEALCKTLRVNPSATTFICPMVGRVNDGPLTIMYGPWSIRDWILGLWRPQADCKTDVSDDQMMGV